MLVISLLKKEGQDRSCPSGRLRWWRLRYHDIGGLEAFRALDHVEFDRRAFRQRTETVPLDG
jgi:hypothetical protein